MGWLIRGLGLGFLVVGMFVLSNNIVFTTNASPYWWRGVAADASIVSLMIGVLMLVLLPRSIKSLGWFPVILGILFVFLSSRAILNPTSLWQFLLSFGAIAAGYRMLLTGRSPL